MRYQPWEPEEGNERAIQQREMRLPPHLQMHGHMRSLRDALLGTYLLSENLFDDRGAPGLIALENIRLRQTQRAELNKRANVLKKYMNPETVKKCEDAAKELLAIEIKRRRVEQLRKFKPGKQTISDKAYRDYWRRARRQREDESWKKTSVREDSQSSAEGT